MQKGKGEEVIGLNVDSKSGNDFNKTKCIENVLCHNRKEMDNRKLRKGRNKTYADVVSGWLDLSIEEMTFDTQNNNEVNFEKRDDQKRYRF